MISRYICFLFFLLLLTNSAWSQKNWFSVQQSSIYSKLLFESEIIEIEERNPGLFNLRLDDRPLERGFISSSISFSYQRVIIDKFKLGVSFRRLTRGLRSNNIALVDSIPDDLFSSNLVIRLHSFEFGLLSEYKLITNQKMELSFRYTITYDAQLALRANFKNFESRFTGHRVSGSESIYARFISNNLGSLINRSFNDKFYRFSHYLSLKIDVNTIARNLKLYSSITGGVSGRLALPTDAPIRSSLPDGNIIYFALDIGMSYGF